MKNSLSVLRIRHSLRLSLLLLLPLNGLAATAENATAVTNNAPANRAVIPVSRFDNATWSKSHHSHIERTRRGDVGLLFLGDSLTAQWSKHPALWEAQFGAFSPANFGIGGDQTEHLLWRLQNGALDGITPATVVLLIGTNNMSKSLRYTPQDITEGVQANLREIRQRLPDARILLVSILPRDAPLEDWLNKKNKATNQLLSKLTAPPGLTWVNLWGDFLNADQTATDSELYSDMTHLSAAGYTRLATVLRPAIEQSMQAAAAPAAR